ncbi:MAG: thiamine biosynthesis protein ThiF [Clostridia bacterium]|nr:thiamine biosynthesis protein ThiF [Clostridia bacterium]
MIPSEKEMYSACEQKHGKEAQKAFSEATVAICGLGGLGSNVAVMLARAGIGKLILIDFDRVDITNLQRQQYKACQTGEYKADALKANLLEIAPYANYKTHTLRITEDNFYSLLSPADIIVEAFDNAEAKAMLVNNALEAFPEKYIVTASGMAGIASGNMIKTRKLTSKLYLCGDSVSGVEDGLGLYSARVAMCASHEALAVLRILIGEYEA